MPQRWNGKFVMGGGAGFAGVVVNIALNFGALQSGYATVGTDSGHYGHPLDASWALNNLERVVSFGHQAVHRTAVTAKALIAGYYGKETSRSLFYGCSRGGGQALMEAQRYPEDFDGIVAAGPAYDWTGELGARNIRVSAAMYPDPERLDTPVISAAKQQLIGAAVLAKCDAMDGLEDGILNNPLMCDFDVQSLKCGDQPAPSCLTEEELTTVRTIYEDFYVDGALVYPGYPPGAELYPGGWSRWLTGGAEASGNFQSGIEVPPDLPVPSGPNFHFSFGNGVMKYLVFHDPDWDYSQYSFDSYFKDVAAASQTLDAKDPNLDAFRARGGKLLLANSWGDSAINPKGTISYYEKVIERDPSAVDDVRLILFPGVEHCAGGPGPWFVNFVQVIDQWVETGAAPEKLEPFWLNERMEPEGSRLACAYPEYPVYTGSGDTRDASSFRCEGAGAVADSD
jgi:feruloyl esterase